MYVQDHDKEPVQLTISRLDNSPIFSDDGEKIVYYPAKTDDDNSVYSINFDGSEEQIIITNDWLNALGLGTKAGALAFVPGTHQLFFNTYQCMEDIALECTVGLFSVNTDTGEIKKILNPTPSGYLPFGGQTPWRGNFQISYDGKLLSVAMSGHISIFDIDGEVIDPNIMTYTRSTPIELFPRVSWLTDSSGIVVALPAESNYGAGYEMTPNYTVWQYDFPSHTATRVPLDPSPKWVYMECADVMYVSPDANWVVFHQLEDNAQLYVGNLGNGRTQSYPIDIDCSPVYWSIDGKYFVYGRLMGTFLGAVNTPLIPINGNFLGWVDTTHFLYSHFPNQKEVLIGEIREESIMTYASGISLQEGYSPYSFTSIVFDPKTNR